MIINRTSWHYRLLSALDFNIPRSLCPYFWKTMFALAFSLIVIIVCCVIFGAMTYGLGYAVFYNVPLVELSLIDHLICVGVSLLIDIGITSIVLLFFYIFVRDFRETIHEKVYESRFLKNIRKHDDYYDYQVANKKGDFKVKKKNLLVEFLKAKKEKVCPTLEFK